MERIITRFLGILVFSVVFIGIGMVSNFCYNHVLICRITISSRLLFISLMLSSFYYRIGRHSVQNGFSHSSTFFTGLKSGGTVKRIVLQENSMM